LASMIAIRLLNGQSRIDPKQSCIPSCTCTADKIEMLARPYDSVRIVGISVALESIHNSAHDFQL
jgi:hypothetical protein